MKIRGNLSNDYQGTYRRVLCVCSAGLLRSPTMAYVLSRGPYNYNTRSAGIEASYALNLVDENLLMWAQEIVCAEPYHRAMVTDMMQRWAILNKKIVTLDLPDIYDYRAPKLIKLIKERYDAVTQRNKSNETTV